MRTHLGLVASRLALLGCLALVGGCSNPTTTYTCDPVCPTGWQCGAGGCVLIGAGAQPDLSVPAGDMVAACLPACSGATPFCDANLNCVACRLDADCPLGQQCGRIGTIAQCLGGCTDDSRCPAGTRCCSGACTDTTSDASNCGACTNVCTSAHASSSCQASGCVTGACESGWGDCNGNPGDGCETNLAFDADNCGKCAAGCTIAHGSGGCSNTCYLAACDFGWGDCNGDVGDGCEMPVLSDVKNCGACGNSCPAQAHAVSACIDGTCQLAKCVQGFADCDGNPLNGCEVATGTDKSNCGVCGNVCLNTQVCRNSACTCPACNFPNAKSACKNDVCVMGECLPGYSDCNKNPKDGCEIDLTSDTNNCGACNTVCNEGEACNDGMCQAIQCMRLGWKQGNDNWDCPQGLHMPTVNDFMYVMPCIEMGDLPMFNDMNDIAVSVGGCNCKWNNNWCGKPSIETMRQGRCCGDYDQLHICIN